MAARILILGLVVALLWATGMLELNLPWNDSVFQVTGISVLIYLLWSLAEGSRRRPGLNAPQLAMYVVLLVSAADSFVLSLTLFTSPMALRWAGAALLAAGSGLRLAAAYSSTSPAMLRAGRALQVIGLPLGLGSLAGLAVGVVPAMVVSVRADESGSFVTKDDDREEPAE